MRIFNFSNILTIFRKTLIFSNIPIAYPQKIKFLSIINQLQRLRRLSDLVKRLGLRQTYYYMLREVGTFFNKTITGPRVIRINPTDYICNHRCPMCYLQTLNRSDLIAQRRHEVKVRMMLDGYITMLDSIKGLQEVNLVGGGEPLMHPDCVEIMREIKRRGLYGSLVTNGVLITPKVGGAIIEMGWDCTRVSVNAGERESYILINGVDQFDLLKENLKTFVRLRKEASAVKHCQLHLYFVIQRNNLDGIQYMFDFADDIGGDVFIEFNVIIGINPTDTLTNEEKRKAANSIRKEALNSSIPCNRDSVLQLLYVPELELPPDELGPLLDNSERTPAAINTCASCQSAFDIELSEKQAAEQLPLPVTEGSKPVSMCEEKTEQPLARPFLYGKQCIVGFRQTFVRATGDVLPCCFSNETMGNILQQSFKEVWYGEKYNNFRKRVMNGNFPTYCHAYAPSCSLEVVRPANHAVVTNSYVKIHIMVKNAFTGESIPHAHIFAKDTGAIVTDDNGKIVIPAVEPKDYILHIVANGYMHQADVPVAVRPDIQDQFFEFSLQPSNE